MIMSISFILDLENLQGIAVYAVQAVELISSKILIILGTVARGTPPHAPVKIYTFQWIIRTPQAPVEIYTFQWIIHKFVDATNRCVDTYEQQRPEGPAREDVVYRIRSPSLLLVHVFSNKDVREQRRFGNFISTSTYVHLGWLNRRRRLTGQSDTAYFMSLTIWSHWWRAGRMSWAQVRGGYIRISNHGVCCTSYLVRGMCVRTYTWSF
jgi:hypothetical protein